MFTQIYFHFFYKKSERGNVFLVALFQGDWFQNNDLILEHRTYDFQLSFGTLLRNETLEPPSVSCRFIL